MATQRAYRERLWPRWPLLVAVAGALGMLAVAYGAALGTGLGWAVGLGGIAVAAVVVIATSPVVAVDADGVHAGSAVLPLWAVGEVTVVARDGLDAARAPGAAVFSVVRGPLAGARRGVRIDVTDPGDPHTAWVLSTARPQRLADAIRASVADTTRTASARIDSTPSTGAGPEGH